MGTSTLEKGILNALVSHYTRQYCLWRMPVSHGNLPDIPSGKFCVEFLEERIPMRLIKCVVCGLRYPADKVCPACTQAMGKKK